MDVDATPDHWQKCMHCQERSDPEVKRMVRVGLYLYHDGRCADYGRRGQQNARRYMRERQQNVGLSRD